MFNSLILYASLLLFVKFTSNFWVKIVSPKCKNSNKIYLDIYTLKFIRGPNKSHYLHADLGFCTVSFAGSAAHSEQQVGGGEAVPVSRMTERILRPKAEFKSFRRISI